MSDRLDYPWQSLLRELELWRNSGKNATFWWRDDDAVEETSELKRLGELSEQLKLPLALATIPSQVQNSLQRYLHDKDNFKVLQHGYSHSSHAVAGMKKIEIGGNRTTEEIQTEMEAGYEQLQSLFGAQFLPVLVPPWNRIESRCYNALAMAGFSGVSSMWARASAYPVAGLLQVNTHLDPVAWRGDRGFIGESRSIMHIQNHLYARRTGLSDIDEPTGILTHHLAQTEQVWDFIGKLMGMLNEHPAVAWLDAGTIWSKDR